MKIDKKVNVYNTTASFIIFSFILVLGIVGMFMFLNLMGRNTTYPDLETTTTENKSETTTTTTTSSDTNTISYVAKLSNIIGSTKIQKDYDVRIEYQGTNYYFRCTKYDKDNNECNTGFALLNYDNVSIPLYIFDNKEDDFLNNNDEYYIIVDGEYVVLTYNNKTTIYTKDGKTYHTIDKVLTEFNTTDSSISKVNSSIPIIKDDTLIYYNCDTNTVIKKVLSLKNKQLNSSEKIDNGICE